jgi:hypothetical protein
VIEGFQVDSTPEEIAVGERSGITVPTRLNFQNAGYPRIITRQSNSDSLFVLKGDIIPCTV